MTAIKTRISDYFFSEADSTPLVAFRIIFGTLMLFGVSRFLFYGWVEELYIRPNLYFPYLGFEWITPLPGNWMYLPFILMLFACLGILLGWYYRFSAWLFFICFTYVELLDKSNYLNHYYFVSLVAFILCWVPANADLSIDARRNKRIRQTKIPAWSIRLLQWQLGIVYFFAGVAKLNSDWLMDAQPLKIWLQGHRDLPIVGTLLATTWVAYFFSWFGCLYDLSIPFFLSNRKTRPFAYFFVVVFHIVTWLLFPIGVFPWVMIFSTLIFFPASFHKRWIYALKSIFNKKNTAQSSPTYFAGKTSRLTKWCMGIFIAAQLLIPMRYLLYPGDLFWTEEGFRFSWRVMLMHKEGYATFYIVDPKTGGSIQIENARYLSPTQEDQMATQPDMVLQYAHYLGNIYQDTLLQFGNQKVHLKNPKVEAEIYVSLNGRPHQLFISRKTDLMKKSYNLKHRTWLEPFQSH